MPRSPVRPGASGACRTLASRRAGRERPQRLRGPAARRRRPPRRGADVRARRLPPRPHVRRQPQPLGVHGRGRARAGVGRRSSELVGQAIDDIDMDAHTGEHPRIGAVDVIPFVPARRHDDGRLRRAGARRSGARIAARWDLPVYLYAQAADARRPGEARRRPARPVRGPQGRDRRSNGRQPDFGPDADAPAVRAPSPSARGRSSSPGTSTSPRTTSSSPSGSPGASASPAAGCRGSRPTGSGSRSRSAAPGPGPGLDEPARLPHDADVARVGRRRRAGRRGRRRAGRVRAHRPRPARRAARRRRPRRRPGGRSGRATRLAAAAGRDPAARLLPADGPRAAAGGAGPRRRRPADRHDPPPDRGRPRPRPTPRASWSTGPRRSRRSPAGCGAAPRRPTLAVLDAAAVGGPGSPEAPVVACWEGRIVAVGPRTEVEAGLEAAGLRRWRGSPGSMPTAASSRPASSTPTRTCCSPARASSELILRQGGAGYLEILAAGGGILSTVAADARRGRRGARARTAGAGSTRCSRHGVTTIEAKSGYGLDLADRAAADRRRLASWAARARSTSCPTYPRRPRRPARVPHRARTAPRRTSATSSTSSCRASRRRAGPRRATCSASRACSRADQSRRILAGGGRLRDGAPAPRGRARAVGRRGAGGRARGRCRPTTCTSPSDAGVDALARGRRQRLARPSRRCCRPRPGSSWPTTPRPARRFIDAGVPVALGTDFNPGTSPTPNLPLVMTVACLEMRLTPAEALAAVTINAAHAVGVAERGRVARARQAGGPRRLAGRLDRRAPVLGRRQPRRRRRCKRGRIVLHRRGADAREAPPSGRSTATPLDLLPRDSRRTVVVSGGRLDVVTDELRLDRRLGAHLVEELA